MVAYLGTGVSACYVTGRTSTNACSLRTWGHNTAKQARST